MTARDALERIRNAGLVPVVRAASAEDAEFAVAAMVLGGLSVAEVTMTVPGAVATIAKLRSLFADTLIGAGTVTDASQAETCLAAGAQFVVGPTFDAGVLEVCLGRDVACIPGALSPTEVSVAWSAGATAVKVFPCGSVGGPSYVRALRGPFPNVPLVPTGGVRFEDLAAYFAAGATAVGVGGELLPPDVVARHDTDALLARAVAYSEAVAEARATG